MQPRKKPASQQDQLCKKIDLTLKCIKFQDVVKLLSDMTPVELMRFAALFELGDETVSANTNKEPPSIEFAAAN